MGNGTGLDFPVAPMPADVPLGRLAWGNSGSVPVSKAETGAPDPGSDSASRPTSAPPGLEFLGREPPSRARIRRPPPAVADLQSLRPSPHGVASGVRSSHFAEYGKGRVPGSPSLEELRASASLASAPSNFSVESTRRTFLFPTRFREVVQKLSERPANRRMALQVVEF